MIRHLILAVAFVGLAGTARSQPDVERQDFLLQQRNSPLDNSQPPGAEFLEANIRRIFFRGLPTSRRPQTAGRKHRWLVEVDPQFGIHRLVKNLKGVTSHNLGKECPRTEISIAHPVDELILRQRSGGSTPGSHQAIRGKSKECLRLYSNDERINSEWNQPRSKQTNSSGWRGRLGSCGTGHSIEAKLSTKQTKKASRNRSYPTS
jgi:hypothetical protein